MRKTLEQFIEDAQIIHKDKYDYSKVEYVNNNTKVRIICKNHGIFKILPTNFLSNSGCKKCAFEKLSKDRSLDKNEFIQKAKEIHCDKYDYGLVDYKNNYTKVIIICPIHSEFEQTPVTHLKKSGCKKCGNINSANKQIMSFLDFKTKADLIFNKIYIYIMKIHG